MPAEGYLERLAVWVKQEKDRHLFSNEGLAAAISEAARTIGNHTTISHAAVYKWESGSLKGRLRKQSIDAIAAYKGESFEQTKAWLEGRPVRTAPPTLQDHLNRLIEHVSHLANQIDRLATRIEALDTQIQELRREQPQSLPSQKDEFAAMVAQWQEKYSPSDREFHLEFFQLSEADLEEFRTGRAASQEELQALKMLFGQDVARLVTVKSSKANSAPLAMRRGRATY